ncbi:hypothetical protein Cgig2_022319 [Carnegiea gigantea]|uniref:Large ribosomal subunit protein uL29m n=1 Tax=Carnegiea gigantea TaxID=171969 RepID=A0A9Q1Q7B1_9CARY|nr:hypothetical protein Cgig2_022319 [Carnegiea gigantea]
MFLRRICGRMLMAATKSEHPGATATAAASASVRNPLEEFFEADRSADDDKRVVYGRSWKASELRHKSWDDLHKLWYVLLKEKNMLMTQRQMLNAQNLRFPNPERISKVRKSMCRIKHVLTERAIEDPDPRRSAEMKRMDRLIQDISTSFLFFTCMNSPIPFNPTFICKLRIRAKYNVNLLYTPSPSLVSPPRGAIMKAIHESQLNPFRLTMHAEKAIATVAKPFIMVVGGGQQTSSPWPDIIFGFVVFFTGKARRYDDSLLLDMAVIPPKQ